MEDRTEFLRHAARVAAGLEPCPTNDSEEFWEQFSPSEKLAMTWQIVIELETAAGTDPSARMDKSIERVHRPNRPFAG